MSVTVVFRILHGLPVVTAKGMASLCVTEICLADILCITKASQIYLCIVFLKK